MTKKNCPGAIGIKGTPELKIKKCPDCGGEIELFADEIKAVCANCGFAAYNDAQSCVSWCRHAKECVGDEIYERLINSNRARS